MSAIGAVLRTLVDYGTDVPAAQRRRFLALALLELDRLERRVAPKRPEPRAVHDVNGLIEPSVALRRLAGQEVHWAPRDLRVLCMRDPVVEVLNGLLANAAAHAPGAPVWITADAVGSRVQIVVRDGGPGVPSAVRDVVFERGRRGARSTGQGIGLWVAARLIEEQSGTLRLLPNTPGEGAAFAIALPLAGPAVAP